MKKITGVVLSIIMALLFTMTAVAATVTVENNVSRHTFKAYAVFTGTQQDGSSVLSDVKWADAIDSSAFLVELKEKSNLFDACATASDVAEVLDGYSDDSTEAKLFASIAYNHIYEEKGIEISTGTATLAEGYYLIVDVTEVGMGDSYNAALLQVTGKENVVIGLKKDQPKVIKKIEEDGELVDVIDCSIGDTVNFVVTSKVPDMTYYDTYKMIFHDSMSSGLSFDDNVAITIGTDNDKVVLTKGTHYTVTESSSCTKADLCSFEIAINDLKSISGIRAGQTITVTYSATVNSNATIGLPGNPNKIKLEYSNNPNVSGGNQAHETGTTIEDVVIVFTYKLNVSKVDGDDYSKKLSGAQFILYRMNGATKEYAVLAEGKISDWVSAEDDATVLVSGDDGLFSVAGVDAGTYYLKEINAPVEYNLLDKPVEFTITATLETGEWETTIASDAFSKLEITVPDDDDTTEDTAEGSTDGTVNITIENKKGAVLPETGGMGTKIFYVTGVILVLGAGVMLIVRKRMKK